MSFPDKPARSSAFVAAAHTSDSKRSRCCAISVLSYGFRPFFLGAAMWAILSLTLWIGVVAGVWSVAARYGAVAWHGHEALFGYGGAVVAGFLLTAIANWTGRPPLAGFTLFALFALWCVGRVGLLLSDMVPLGGAVAIDSAFLPLLMVFMAREIIVARNWRNVKTLVLVGLFTAANIGFHAEVMIVGAPDISARLGVAALVGLIMLIGGRIVPNFTHNWLLRQNATRLPVPFNALDVATLLVSAAALLVWIGRPHRMETGLLLVLSAAAQTLRLGRWAGASTWREPLVLILHIGYGFIPLGFFLVALAMFAPQLMQPMAALHAWTVGAVGVMTLAVMTRATLGHTGRPLNASRLTSVTYAFIILAALARIASGISPLDQILLVEIAAAAWVIAFALFLIEYAPMLVGRAQKA